MGKLEIAIVFIILLVVSFLMGHYSDLLFASSNSAVTGDVVEEKLDYTWTRAVCNDANECLDVVVSCVNGQVKEIKPISDIISHSPDWKDPRNESRYCD